jgi:hypothetical protein
LDDRDPVEGGVELPVAAAVEAVVVSGLAGAAGDGCDAAEAGVGGGAAETADISGGAITATATAGRALMTIARVQTECQDVNE